MSDKNNSEFDLATNAFNDLTSIGLTGDSYYINNDITFNQDQRSEININGEILTHDLVKRMRIMFDLLENDPKYKELNDDINTQLAFETLQGKNNEN